MSLQRAFSVGINLRNSKIGRNNLRLQLLWRQSWKEFYRNIGLIGFLLLLYPRKIDLVSRPEVPEGQEGENDKPLEITIARSRERHGLYGKIKGSILQFSESKTSVNPPSQH